MLALAVTVFLEFRDDRCFLYASIRESDETSQRLPLRKKIAG